MRNSVIEKVYVALGVVVGGFHFYAGSISIFLMQGGAPSVESIIVIVGLLMTLPAFLIGLRAPQVASSIFLACSTVVLAAMVVTEGMDADHLLKFAIMATVPTFALAVLCWKRIPLRT